MDPDQYLLTNCPTCGTELEITTAQVHCPVCDALLDPQRLRDEWLEQTVEGLRLARVERLVPCA